MASVPKTLLNFELTKRQPKLESYILLSVPKALEGLLITNGDLVICSTPPASIKSPAPELIAL